MILSYSRKATKTPFSPSDVVRSDPDDPDPLQALRIRIRIRIRFDDNRKYESKS